MAMDVTEARLDYITTIIYGCSDNTNQGRTAAGKSLNYANGASIQKAPEYELNAIPFTHKYEDTVGLFGAENYYIDFHADILDIVLKPFLSQDGKHLISSKNLHQVKAIGSNLI